MSRPQKIHPPLKGDFNSILTAVALGSGKGKRAALKLAKVKPTEPIMLVVPEGKPIVKPKNAKNK